MTDGNFWCCLLCLVNFPLSPLAGTPCSGIRSLAAAVATHFVPFPAACVAAPVRLPRTEKGIVPWSAKPTTTRQARPTSPSFAPGQEAQSPPVFSFLEQPSTRSSREKKKKGKTRLRVNVRGNFAPSLLFSPLLGAVLPISFASDQDLPEKASVDL